MDRWVRMGCGDDTSKITSRYVQFYPIRIVNESIGSDVNYDVYYLHMGLIDWVNLSSHGR